MQASSALKGEPQNSYRLATALTLPERSGPSLLAARRGPLRGNRLSVGGSAYSVCIAAICPARLPRGSHAQSRDRSGELLVDKSGHLRLAHGADFGRGELAILEQH